MSKIKAALLCCILSLLLNSDSFAIRNFFVQSSVFGPREYVDYCNTSTLTDTFVVMNTIPGRTYKWYIQDHSNFSSSGSSPYVLFATGVSIAVLINGPFGAPLSISTSTWLKVEELDANMIPIAADIIGIGVYGSLNVPVRYNESSCRTLSVPDAFFGEQAFFIHRSVGSWFRDGVNLGQPGASTGNMTVQAIKAGNYQYKLTLGCLGSDTLKSAVYSITDPADTILNLTANGALTVCNGDTIKLQISGNFHNIKWYKDNVQISAATSYYYNATSNGSYSVRAQNAINCSYISNTINITVQTGVFISSVKWYACQGDSIKLDCSAASSYVWRKNGNVIAGANTQSIYVKATGDYTVSTTGLTCNTSKVKMIDIVKNPVITNNYSSVIEICKGDTIRLTMPSTNATNYSWTKDNIFLGGSYDSSLVVFIPGSYKFKAENTKHGSIGCAKTSRVVYVGFLENSLPVKTISLKPGIEGIDTYAPEPVGAINSNTNMGNSPFLEVSTRYSGTYSARAYIKFDLSSLPKYARIISASLKLYVDTLALWTNPSQQMVSLDMVATEWKEDSLTQNKRPGALNSLSNVLIPHDSIVINNTCKIVLTNMVRQWKFFPEKNYGLSLQIANEGLSAKSRIRFCSSDNSDVSKRPKLTISYTYADIIANGPLTFCAGDSVEFTSNPGYTYSWYRNNALIANATGSSYTVKTAGNYFVIITDMEGCTAKSATRTVSVPCRLAGYESEISISPNPSQDAFKIESEDTEALQNVQIFDMNGKLIRDYSTLESGSFIGEDLKSGVYLLQSGNNIHQRKKIVKL